MSLQQTDILCAIRDNPLISTEELAQMFEVKSTIMAQRLSYLLKQGYIKKTSTRPSHWVEVKGACTPKKSTKPCRTRMIEYDGRTMPMKDWCAELGLNYNTVNSRLRLGWSVEDAFDHPVGASRRMKR